MEYSLNTPINNYNNMLDLKIINIIKNNNMIGGIGGTEQNFIFIIIIGIIIIIIGFYLYFNKDDLICTKAKINNIICNPTSNLKSECKINITYLANKIHYSKTIIIDNSIVPPIQESMITIYYKQSNPNIVRLYNFDNSIIGISLIIIGIIIILSILYSTNNIESNI